MTPQEPNSVGDKERVTMTVNTNPVKMEIIPNKKENNPAYVTRIFDNLLQLQSKYYFVTILIKKMVYKILFKF